MKFEKIIALINQDQEELALKYFERLENDDISIEMMEDFYFSIRGQIENLFEVKDKKVFDVCGTGGSGKTRVNLSTILAIHLSKDFAIAKHANKASSGKVGSIDLLEQMKIKVCNNNEEALRQIEKNNLAFLYAKSFHPVVAKFANIRKQIGKPTIFNFLMPLLNPVSNLTAQFVGASDEKMMSKMAQLALKLNKNAIFVHDVENKLDDVSITGKTAIIEIYEKQTKEYIIIPEDFGLQRVSDFSKIAGYADVEKNANLAIQILNNEANLEYKNFLLINKIVAIKFFENFL
ncbi:MAG: hypothetical protein RL208_382 [Pseudomonadota bacterium]|jgi:anthranilate phosphoribosyltransferase